MAARDLCLITTRAQGQSPRARVWLSTINPMVPCCKYYISYLIGSTSGAKLVVIDHKSHGYRAIIFKTYKVIHACAAPLVGPVR